jgi:transposase
MRTVYPSDVSRLQFGLIEHDLQSARKATRPRKYDLYDIFCAVLYVLKEGCTWRALPHDFPK